MRFSLRRPAAALPLLIIATASGCGSDSGPSGGGGGEAVNGTGYFPNAEKRLEGILASWKWR